MSDPAYILLIAAPQRHRTPAFERATALAEAMQLPLRILAVDYLESLALTDYLAPDQARAAKEGYMATRRAWLEEQAAAARELNIPTTAEVVWGANAYEEIRHFFTDPGLAMVIKDARHIPALQRVFYTPLDWRLLSDCPVPVHLVTQTGHARPRKLLALIDVALSEKQDTTLNESIVKAALRMAERCGAQLDLLHVYDWGANFAMAMALGSLAVDIGFDEKLRVEQRQAFHKLGERLGIPARHRHFVEGTVRHSIEDFVAQHETDVIVLGTAHRPSFKRLLGGTAEHLLYAAPCSLLVVRPASTLADVL